MIENLAKRQTLELIKEAIYELEIGPCEISFSAGYPNAYHITIVNYGGESKQVLVPIASDYLSIQNSLRLAFKPAK